MSSFGKAGPGPHPHHDDVIVFGPFQLQVASRLLRRDGEPVALGGRALDLLITLVQNASQTLTKRYLLSKVWPDVSVDPGSLRFHMASVRKALGDGRDGARYIETQVGHGYCFVAETHIQAPMRDDADTLTAASGSRGRIPPRLARMIGRRAEIADIRRRLKTVRCLSVVGSGGVGKTTVALAVAHELRGEFAEQVAFVDLAVLREAQLTAAALAAHLGTPVRTDDATPAVLKFLRARRMLVVFDNCEHVIEATSVLVEAILDAAPNVSLLTTSREALRVEGEHVYRLASLATPSEDIVDPAALLSHAAAELFVERMEAGGAAFDHSPSQTRLIGQICRNLDGIPLALELGAGRVGAIGLEQTASLLDAQLSLGWIGRRTASPRQQTLQATLDWSYSLLTDLERRVLGRLSAFVGVFTSDAAWSVVCDTDIDPPTAQLAIDSLTAKSLLAQAPGGYRLLETTRAFALERFGEASGEERENTLCRHAVYYQGVLEAASRGDPASSPTQRVISPDLIGNARAALAWAFGAPGKDDIALRLAAWASALFLQMSLLTECRSWCERALGRTVEGLCEAEMELQAALGLAVMFTRGYQDSARLAFERALAIAEERGDHLNQLRLLGRLHFFHERIGDFDGAFQRARQGLEVGEQVEDRYGFGVAESCLGISFHLKGDHFQAQRYLEAARRISPASQRAGTTYFGFDHRNRAGIALARTLWLKGLPDQAIAAAEAAVAEATRLDHPITQCIALIWAVSVYLWTGELEKAEAAVDLFIAQAEIHALGPNLAVGLGVKGELAIRKGEIDWGVTALQDCLARLHAARYELLTAAFNTSLAEGLVAAGRRGEATTLLNETLALVQRNGDLFLMPELLRIKGRMLLPLGKGAEPFFYESLRWSRRQGALSWELRTAIDLAARQVDCGQVARARALLSEVRGRFREGEGTADLMAADARLEAWKGLDDEGAAA
jgi:predicted ATPase/DNA-binding winged helix-turn-helix (wHTH) protein